MQLCSNRLILKSLSFILFALCFVLYLVKDQLSVEMMKYLWPVHLIIILFGAWVTYRSTKDIKNVDAVYKIAKVGNKNTSKMSLWFLKTTINIGYVFLTIAPAVALVFVGILDVRNLEKYTESDVMFVFAEAWLVFSSVFVFYAYFVHGIYSDYTQKWLTKVST